MTLEERAGKAKELKALGKCNCTQSVLKVFELDIEKYNRLDKESRRYIAYHEAGHYIVSRLSEKLKDMFSSIRYTSHLKSEK